MAKFFTSSKDLLRWVKENNSSYKEASDKLLSAVGSDCHQQDIIETTKRIFSNNNIENAADVLFGLLSNFDITEKSIREAEATHDEAVVAEALSQHNITSQTNKKVTKYAQIMRQPGQYDMPLRVCPKLPNSVGKGLISTYNCRHYCVDSISFDEDPTRIYCAEALWRGHVMDKFSREWQDAKTGEWVGGYINNRFYVFPDAGTPGNPDVDRYHGNKMTLAPWERSRQPRKHEWSVERRLQEQREPGSTKSNTLYNVVASTKNKITITSENKKSGDCIEEIFSQAIDMQNRGITPEDAVLKLSETYGKPIEVVVAIRDMALRKMASHQADAYKVAAQVKELYQLPATLQQNSKMYFGDTEVTNQSVGLRPVTPHAVQPKEIFTQPQFKGKVIFDVLNPENAKEIVGQVVVGDGSQNVDINSLPLWEDVQGEDIQKGAEDVGLNENIANKTKSPAVAPETNVPEPQTPLEGNAIESK